MIEKKRFQRSLGEIDEVIVPPNVSQLVGEDRLELCRREAGESGRGDEDDGAEEAEHAWDGHPRRLRQAHVPPHAHLKSERMNAGGPIAAEGALRRISQRRRSHPPVRHAESAATPAAQHATSHVQGDFAGLAPRGADATNGAAPAAEGNRWLEMEATSALLGCTPGAGMSGAVTEDWPTPAAFIAGEVPAITQYVTPGAAAIASIAAHATRYRMAAGCR